MIEMEASEEEADEATEITTGTIARRGKIATARARAEVEAVRRRENQKREDHLQKVVDLIMLIIAHLLLL